MSQGDGGISIPYKGYIEANLTILNLPCYNEDVPFVVAVNYKYGDRVAIQIGSQVIGHLVVTLTEKELQRAREA